MEQLPGAAASIRFLFGVRASAINSRQAPPIGAARKTFAWEAIASPLRRSALPATPRRKQLRSIEFRTIVVARATGVGIANARLANNPLDLRVRRDLLLFQQGHLAFDSPAVAGNTPVPAQNSMAGDHHRQSIRSNRPGNGAN